MTTKQYTHVRWMIRCDMPEIMEIERSSFFYPWPEEDFIKTLRGRNNIGMVAEINDQVVGFMIYQLEKRTLNILNFAVAKGRRRQGIGSDMLMKLKNKLSYERRNKITATIGDHNLEAHLFFKTAGFRCIQMIRGGYGEYEQDSYLFRYLHSDPIND
jgi:[ribosomal protein S18]-alanine N-acetyltransferase